MLSFAIGYFFWGILMPAFINFAGGDGISPFAKLAIVALVSYVGGIGVPLFILVIGVLLAFAVQK